MRVIPRYISKHVVPWEAILLAGYWQAQKTHQTCHNHRRHGIIGKHHGRLSDEWTVSLLDANPHFI
jgi:hypothetical protein